MPPHQPSSAEPLWDMLGARLPRGVLGLSDPDVHRDPEGWTMLIGAFTTGFRNRIVSARADATSPVERAPWVLDPRPLVADPPRGAWDGGGMHTPCHVPAHRGQPERIYYAGRAGRRHFGHGSAYAIGVLTRLPCGRWERSASPVLTGTEERPSVLEPRVIAVDGGFRMWFLATPHEVGPGEQPDFEMRVADSADGLRWGAATVFSSTREGFFDSHLHHTGEDWLMLLARGTNLHGTRPYPAQGLWARRAASPSPDPADWSPPRRVLDTDAPGAPGWMAHGVCGPSAVPLDDGRLLVFATGTHDVTTWRQASRRRWRESRRIAVPAPYHLATGRLIL